MRRIFRPFSLLLACCLLSGCTAGPEARLISPPPGSLPPVELSATPSEEAAGSYNAYAVDLLRTCQTEGENTLLSPLSVALALGMTANGAQGDTQAAFEALFGMDQESLNGLCAQFLSDYGQLGGSTQVTIANSLWCSPSIDLEESFILRCQQTYLAQLFQLDFQDPDAPAAVNRWVEEATRGLIPSVIDQFDPDTVLALINTIYLSNQFQRPFETPSSHWQMDFTATNGSVTRPHGMSNGTRQERYLSHEDGQGVLLPYDDGRLGLILMLPREGLSLDSYLSGWSGQTIPDLLSGGRDTLVQLTCPKFQVQWGGSLKKILSALGLETAFDPDRADFSSTSDGGGLYLGDVIHKTAFELQEKGTQAAAVTAVMMDAKADLPPEDLIYLRFDRPFVYGIVDLELGVPLFLGTMERCPSAEGE